MSREAGSTDRIATAREVSTVAVGMFVFARFAHQGMPWGAVSAVALVAVAMTIGRSLARVSSPSALIGFDRFPRSVTLFAIVGILLGAGAGVLHRSLLGIPLRPDEPMHAFVIVACLIGATEEIVYRGWLQGRSEMFGRWTAVVIAALAHAGYKTALFLDPPAGSVSIDLASVALWTAVGGLVLGGLRAACRNVAPSMLGHAAFDFIVYGALVQSPWWVWQ